MASNSFGNIFKVTTWGESHGKAIGVIIDGCPSGLSIDEEYINQELSWRTPGIKEHTSPRKEIDQVEILSGIFEGKTTGAPISLLIRNGDARSHDYEPIKNLLRPGHANYTYLKKYGCFDHRGGGRASARETACRVAAGAIAKKLLSDQNIGVIAFIRAIGAIHSNFILSDINKNKDYDQFLLQVRSSPLYCPDRLATKQMHELLLQIKNEQDSIGGLVEAIAFNVPVGWGDPVYEKLEANLAKAMLSIPASKGFEIGEGFASVAMKGSQYNDLFYQNKEKIELITNHGGGTLGGISNGMPIVIRVPFKPASSIGKNQLTLNLEGESETLILPSGSRHDPCVAIRAVPVVEAMFALTLVDAMLMQKINEREI